MALDSQEQRLSLTPYLGYYEDQSGQMPPDQVRALDAATFRPIQAAHPNLGKNASAWWFRVDLDNRLEQPQGGYLEVNYPLLDHVQVHLFDPQGQHLQQESGDRFAFAQRLVQVRNFWFPLQLEPGNSTLLVRVETTSTVFVPMFFATYGASAAAQENLMGFNGAFYGVLFAMFCYNLFLYLSLRESAYLWYLAYNLNVGLLAACFDGMLFKLLPEHLALQSVAINALRQALTGLYENPQAQVHPLIRERPDDTLEAPCILVAEDNPVNQLVVQGFLKKRGYRVRLVTDGQAAVAEYERDPAAVHLILMDCEMPVMDGFEATRQIRRLERNRQLAAVPVIALTAHILEEHRQHGLDAGMDDFLGKPLDSGLLYRTLERYLKPAEP